MPAVGSPEHGSAQARTVRLMGIVLAGVAVAAMLAAILSLVPR